MRFQEYDVVELRKPLEEVNVPLGTRGTVLMVYDSPTPEYEVEFVSSTGETLALVTIGEDYLLKVKY